jgi:tRNA (pseudouridine54-N1)-methyltransferase
VVRTFVVVGHDAPTDAGFSLDDLPGAGRLDLLARSVTAGLLRSHGIREDTRVALVLADTYTVWFDGSALRGLHPDERSTAALVRTALDEREEAVGHIPVEVSPGLSLVRLGLAGTLDATEGPVVQLHEDGTPVVDLDPPENPVFVLSDHQSFRPDEAALLADVDARQVSLGPEVLHADQAVTVAHNWLDTGGFSTVGRKS